MTQRLVVSIRPKKHDGLTWRQRALGLKLEVSFDDGEVEEVDLELTTGWADQIVAQFQKETAGESVLHDLQAKLKNREVGLGTEGV